MANNFDDYMRRVEDINLGSMSRRNLTIPDHEETIKELVDEGNRLLMEEQKTNQMAAALPKNDSKNLDATLAINSKNPYISAHAQVLGKMKDADREIIEQMEAGTLKKDLRYERFIKNVIALGDKLSS